MVESSPAWFTSILQSVRGISDRSQRALKVYAELAQHPALEIAEFLKFLMETSSHNPQHQQIHLDLLAHREALHQLSYEQIAAVYEIANERNWSEIQALFRLTSPRWVEDEIKPEVFAQRLASLTLGERKQLSRQVEGSYLEMLVFDEDPLVIASLLSNPKLRERDVVRLASRQGAPARVLEEVCKSKKWSVHYPVRKALVFNPSTPQVYALGFVRHLTQADLRSLLQKGRLSPELEQTARQLRKKRKF